MKIQKATTQITLEKEEKEILKKAYDIITEICDNIPDDSIVHLEYQHLKYHYDSIDIDQFKVLFKDIIDAEQIKIELT